jgi:hypothetical protein
MRLIPNQLPRSTPNRVIASAVYEEQVGWNRQFDPRLGLTNFW